MKKFYTTVSICPTPEGFYQILLDGKPVKTPARNDVCLSSAALADAIAAEWRAQNDQIVPDTMPLLQMATTLQDRVIPQRPHLEAEALDYLDTDLVCYRAEAPEHYRNAQEAAWDPCIMWAEKRFGSPIHTTTGLAPLTQDASLHDAIATHIHNMTDVDFMALYLVTLGAGSVLLALAFVDEALPMEAILNAAFAEEHLKDKIYLSDVYGAAPDQEKRYNALKNTLHTLQQFSSLVPRN